MKPAMIRLRVLAGILVGIAITGCLLGTAVAAAAVAKHWTPLHRFSGEWTGIAYGQSGDGTVSRSYSFAMNPVCSRAWES